MSAHDETRAVAERYARRGGEERYRLLRPEVWQMVHERQRVLLRLLVAQGVTDLSTLRLAEVGCGAGGNLLELLRLGFAPQHLAGAELLPDRFAAATAAHLQQAQAGEVGQAEPHEKPDHRPLPLLHRLPDVGLQEVVAADGGWGAGSASRSTRAGRAGAAGVALGHGVQLGAVSGRGGLCRRGLRH